MGQYLTQADNRIFRFHHQNHQTTTTTTTSWLEENTALKPALPPHATARAAANVDLDVNATNARPPCVLALMKDVNAELDARELIHANVNPLVLVVNEHLDFTGEILWNYKMDRCILYQTFDTSDHFNNLKY